VANTPTHKSCRPERSRRASRPSRLSGCRSETWIAECGKHPPPISHVALSLPKGLKTLLPVRLQVRNLDCRMRQTSPTHRSCRPELAEGPQTLPDCPVAGPKPGLKNAANTQPICHVALSLPKGLNPFRTVRLRFRNLVCGIAFAFSNPSTTKMALKRHCPIWLPPPYNRIPTSEQAPFFPRLRETANPQEITIDVKSSKCKTPAN